MIQQLVVNGCSYMHEYSVGNGHFDLATRLEIPKADTLAVTGCANSRIIRSTLKHSYTNDVPTLYVLGITFLSRWELPINDTGSTFEGRWVNPQTLEPTDSWQFNWKQKDTEVFKDLQFRAVVFAAKDQLEDLMYRLLSMIQDLESRGHKALIYNQADLMIPNIVEDSRFQLLRTKLNFVHALSWISISWQQAHGALTKEYPPDLVVPAIEYQHIAAGDHLHLNSYLTEYIREHKILT
jgi:hypothetical protein